MLSPVMSGTANLYAYLIDCDIKGNELKNAIVKQNQPITESLSTSNMTQNNNSQANVYMTQQTAPKK